MVALIGYIVMSFIWERADFIGSAHSLAESQYYMSLFVALVAASAQGFHLGSSILRASAATQPVTIRMAWPMPGKGGAMKAGTKVTLKEAPPGMEWAQAAWAMAEMPSDGSCYLVGDAA